MVGRGTAAVAAAVVVLVGTGGHACRPERRTLPPNPPTGAPTVTSGARLLTGVPMASPTGLRLLTQGRVLDVDAGTVTRSPFNRWLPVPGGPPILVEELPGAGNHGSAKVSAKGNNAIQLIAPALATVGASRGGRGVWLGEYADQTHCTLREVGLDGRVLRPARAVPCGTHPTAETAAGLWADVDQTSTVLLDPDTLAERARYPRVAPIDEYQVLVFTTTTGDAMEVRDHRDGGVTPLARPPAYGWTEPRVGPVSPDGRWLPCTFGSPGDSPQVMDVWLLDLAEMRWVHMPQMPALTELKATDLAWTADGRLVLLGAFATSTGPDAPVAGQLVTWRPGEATLAARPQARPPQDPGPYSPAVLVLPAA